MVGGIGNSIQSINDFRFIVLIKEELETPLLLVCEFNKAFA